MWHRPVEPGGDSFKHRRRRDCGADSNGVYKPRQGKAVIKRKCLSHQPRGASGRYTRAKFDRICSPTFWLFSGWNCVATTLSFQMLLTNGRP